MSISVIMLVAYMALTILIGLFFALKKQESSSQFLVAKGGLAWGLIIPLLFAEMLAGAATIGKAATGFETGISAVWVNWGMSIGMIMFLLLVFKFYNAMHRKYGVISVPEAFQYMFDQRCRMVMLAIVVVVYCFLYSSQPISAAALIAPMTGANPTMIAWCVSAIFILVTLTGGMKGLAWMNVVHAAVMYAGMTWAAFKSLTSVGGFGSLQQVLPGSYFSFFQPDIWTTLANALGIGLSFLAAATMVTVTFGAKTERDARVGTWIAALLIIPFSVLPAIVGMCARVVMPDIVPNTALFAMTNSLGPVIAGMVGMAVIAAIWSSAPAALLVASASLTRDFYRVLKPACTEKQMLRFSKTAIVVLGIFSTWLGLNASSILGQLYAAFQIRSVVGIVLLFAMLWPRVSSTAAFWSMLSGGVLAAVWYFMGSPFGIASLWPAAGLCIVVLVVLTLCSQEEVSPGYRRYRQALEELAQVKEERKNTVFASR